jgi:hypothetical protein
MSSVSWTKWTTAWLWAALVCAPAMADEKTVYRCPGKPVLYTDALSAKEARDKGCTTLEGTPITIIGAPKSSAGSSGKPSSTAAPAAPRSPESRIDPGEQRSRDNDAKRILNEELQKEEDGLAQLKKEFNNGEPERRGDERNYQKYLDRVAEMKAQIARKESDVAALKRELSKMP